MTDEKPLDTQEHLYECLILVGDKANIEVCYEDLFSDDLEKLLKIGKLTKELLTLRQFLLEPID